MVLGNKGGSRERLLNSNTKTVMVRYANHHHLAVRVNSDPGEGGEKWWALNIF